MNIVNKLLKLYVLGLLIAGCSQNGTESKVDWRGNCKKYYSEDSRAFTKCIENLKNEKKYKEKQKTGKVILEDSDVPTTPQDYGIKSN